MMICPKCSKPILDTARFCPECGAYIPPDGHAGPAPLKIPGGQAGASQRIHPRDPPRSPHLCWWNLLISGLAQIIYGQVGKGVLLLVLTVASNMMLPLLPALVIGIASVIDAFMVGKTLQRGFSVGMWEWFPKR